MIIKMTRISIKRSLMLRDRLGLSESMNVARMTSRIR
jgi:hypothetical protein